MVTDFFYPQPGGVELHVFHLSQTLMDLGHSVIIITHDYGNRKGVRILANGLKVYYVPFLIAHRSCTIPTVFLSFPILRYIFLREDIEIVHGHGSYSNFCHESILHARTMGLRVLFTDHSLFGFVTFDSIVGNKLLKFTLSDIDHVICVSHTCKENTVLRASINPSMVSAIPNAVIVEDFIPSSHKKVFPLDEVTIVVITRLFPNKGADLLTAIIPKICRLKPFVKFLIAGDGPRFLDLEQMREKYFLQDRIRLVGAIRHEEVRDLMVQGDIYLHPSLTEAFGTVLVEAASCGLFVVTTNVGGIPEVLPSFMTAFADPEEDSLLEATLEAVSKIRSGQLDTSNFHEEVALMYSWESIAKRTENVYNSVMSTPLQLSILERLKKYYCCGPVAGKLFVICVILDIFILHTLEIFYPKDKIDLASKWPRKTSITTGNVDHHIENQEGKGEVDN